MKKKSLLYILALFLGILGGTGFSLAEGLEVSYPEARGGVPVDIDTPLGSYVLYIVNVALTISGIVAFSVLLVSGVIYLTSSGFPERMKSAKDGMKSALAGSTLLLLSYLILKTINPTLTFLNAPPLPSLEKQTAATPIEYPRRAKDQLNRIDYLVLAIERTAGELQIQSSSLKSLSDGCSCTGAQSFCSCTGGESGSTCQPRSCYIAKGSEVCPAVMEQVRSAAVYNRDVADYYKNQAVREIEDVEREISIILNPKLAWYTDKIREGEEAVLKQESPSAREVSKISLEDSREKKRLLEKEVGDKKALGAQLRLLVEELDRLNPILNQFHADINQCFTDVPLKCTPRCKSGSDYGCHDAFLGCQPDSCTGGNPCPTEKIASEANAINQSRGKITLITTQIKAIIKGIRENS